MKKHQSSLSPSVKELIALYEKAAAEVANQPLPSTPSAQQRQESSSSSKAKGQKQSSPTTPDDVIYATVTTRSTATLSRYAERVPSQTIYTAVAPQSGLSPIAEENEQTQPVAREEQTPAATAASPRTRLALSEAQITALLKNSRLVREYEEEIQTFCQKVYGNSDALRKQLEQIQKNPSTGEDLSTHMKEDPERIHKFAGKKMLGIKSSARRHANNNLPTLCGLVDSYVAAVKTVREDLSMTPEAVLPYYEEIMGKEAVNRILQNPHSSERSSASLSNDDISERTQQHPMVKKHHAQINYWCNVVFGNSDLFKQQTEAIFENPTLVEELTWSIAESPQSFGRYAGVGVGNLKNRARRHAEAGLPHLISAMGNYANTVQSVREGLTQSQQQQTAQQQHEQTAQTSQTLQRQQEFSRSPQLSRSAKPPESLAATSHQETAGPSRHTQEPAQDVRPRRTTSSKGMALAS
ncbi:BID domain-containing T4SS effector [Bartonella sp. ML70XJBT.G]|uniref:BID domain-containing T4SS effector n=1 Tax=Bartonella sp. ML70XJBT.G TaxID=3019093 RepID=UPI0023614E7E|nr:BID domain-containing T4SS effector [Bartonella sp. ML70XJBT.G]